MRWGKREVKNLVQQALQSKTEFPRMQRLPQAKKVHFDEKVHFRKDNFSMPSVTQIVKNEWNPGHSGARRPYVIGVVGGTNSGKTSVCKKIISEVRIVFI